MRFAAVAHWLVGNGLRVCNSGGSRRARRRMMLTGYGRRWNPAARGHQVRWLQAGGGNGRPGPRGVSIVAVTTPTARVNTLPECPVNHQSESGTGCGSTAPLCRGPRRGRGTQTKPSDPDRHGNPLPPRGAAREPVAGGGARRSRGCGGCRGARRRGSACPDDCAGWRRRQVMPGL